LDEERFFDRLAVVLAIIFSWGDPLAKEVPVVASPIGFDEWERWHRSR
jgi:hypothetical protein